MSDVYEKLYRQASAKAEREMDNVQNRTKHAHQMRNALERIIQETNDSKARLIAEAALSVPVPELL